LAILVAAGACGALLLGGCATKFDHAGPRSPASAITPHTQWRVSGDLTNPAAAADGDLTTAAISQAAYAGAELTVDLGKPCLFNMIVMDHGPMPEGFPRRMAVLTSLDGREFTYTYGKEGNRQRTVFVLITPTLARYIRIKAVVPGSEPWSVGEVFLY
jgi:hypothetical protein